MATDLGPAIVSAGGVIVGGAIVQVGNAWAIRRQHDRDEVVRQETRSDRREDLASEREDRRKERAAVAAASHRAQQRDTMIELQDVLSDYIRAVGAASVSDQRAFLAAQHTMRAIYGGQALPDAAAERINAHQRRLQTLASRVLDDVVREGAARVVVSANGALGASSLDEARRFLSEMGTSSDRLREHVGSLLRAPSRD